MDESLTVPELAQAAGLDEQTAAHYCDRFAEHLIPAEPPAPGRWAPISVALLQIIDKLRRAGCSDAEIAAQLRGEPEPSQPTPGEGAGPSLESARPQDRIAALREAIQQRPLPSDKASPPGPWWRRWRPRR
ncbi:MAG TPA: hypothetical protein VFE37_27260 [Chloroflexota bacterium]|nr:hypothetical protein [Chloroflexota bacterium]